MEPTLVNDASDPRVGDFQRLNDTSLRRQIEAPSGFHHGLIVAEGWLVIERLLTSPYRLRSVLVDAAKLDRLHDIFDSVPRGRYSSASVFAAPQQVIDQIVGFPLHRGVVAIAERARPSMSTVVARRSRRLVVLEGINDAENLGAVCRTAAALGADGLLLDPTCADPLTRRSVRVSMGHALTLPFARLSWPAGLEQLVDDGVTVVALTPSTDAVDINDLELARTHDDKSRVAIVLGAEGPGLSQAAMHAASFRARISMSHGIDSLNVAAAAAIGCHRLFSLVRE